MTKEDAIKWLENLKQDIGQLRHENLWPYAQAIDEVIAMMEEQDTNGWVSVKDRLPKDGQDVLGYLYNGEETRIAPFNYDKGTWYDCVMNCTVAINSITHWMPLPEPPKEVSE